MLEIKRTDSGRYYITLDGVTIKGGMYTEGEAKSYLAGYKSIWDAGYKYGKAAK